MFIRYTYVDHVTKKPVTIEPAKSGPAAPELPGLIFGFALESQYPTDVPMFYGTCKDGTPIDTPGILEVLTQDQYNAARTAEMTTRITLAKNKAYDALKARRQQCEAKGVAITALGTTSFAQPIYVPAAKDDQDRINTVLSSMERWPQIQTVSFKANNNVFVPVTHDQLSMIGLAVAVHVQKCFDNEASHTAAISIMTDVAAIESHDITTGWPDN